MSRANVLELIAFLIMATINTFFLIYNYLVNLINLPQIDHSTVTLCNNSLKTIYNSITICSVTILVLGNIIYYFAAYGAYEDFEDNLMKRIGGKVKLQRCFSWTQFNMSLFKTDLGLIMFLAITTIVFDYEAIAYMIIDCSSTIVIGVLIYYMKDAVKNFHLIQF